MKFERTTAFAAVLLSTIAATASAQEVGDWTASVGVSTFGANYEAIYQLRPNMRLRGAVMGGLNYSGTEEEDGSTFEVDANLSAFAVMADYYPTQSGWRVSGGVLFNGSKLDSTATGSASNPIEIDDQTFSTGSLDVDADFKNTLSPIVTTGYDYRFKNNWIVSGEIGAIYTGGIDLTATGSTAEIQTAINNSDDYNTSRQDASDITFLPYISVTVGYTF